MADIQPSGPAAPGPATSGPATSGLAMLEARLAHDLLMLELPGRPWVPPRTVGHHQVRNVVILGGGMCGLAAAAALRLLGIDGVEVLDRAPAGQEGPWVTFARMQTLRSPKTLAGPALGLPALTFRAWFEAQFGGPAWDALGKIPKAQWMDYLVWYRHAMQLHVRNDIAVSLIHPHLGSGPDGLLTLDTPQGLLLARHVVLATGRDGLGGPFLPAIAGTLPSHLWAHSRDPIDFAALRGKRVGVVGAGASAMDNAAAALEAGAARLDLFVRRAALPAVNKLTGVASPGFVHGFEALPDDWKWRFLHYALGAQTPPPRDSTLRVARHPHAHLHLASPIESATEQDGRLHLRTPHGAFDLDFLIFATGFRTDLAARPELAAIAPHIRFWRDRFPDAESNDELAWSPDLAPDFAFQERTPGDCPALAHIHCFNYPATLSHGKLTGDIPAVSEGAQRLARGIARRLFTADREQHYARLQAYAVPELHGNEWDRT